MTQVQEKYSISNKQSTDIYDVVICGGGLAGMTLARQLTLQINNISILVIDRMGGTLPNAAFKVGESCVEGGAYYLGEILQLTDYFKANHLPKLGLRFFLGNPQDSFQERPEFGIAKFHSPDSYQIDRGLLENDLRRFNIENGIEFLENCSIQDVSLSANDDLQKVMEKQSKKFHTVTYKQLDKKTTQTVKAHWVVDAMGTRRFLQRKLGLAKPRNEKYNAAWFRVNDRIDVSDFVPITEKEWHARVPNKIRYFSTNHLVGEGYFVWLIPLPTGYTSIGIVANQDFHAFEDFHTYEKAYKWLEKNEPMLAAQLKGKQPSDFKKMPRYNYSSSQIFSLDRWTCVGVAGTFLDPFYSLGMDMIGFANSLTTEMIRLDLDGKLTKQMTNYANAAYLEIQDNVSLSIQRCYQIFGSKNSLIINFKILCNIITGWSVTTPMIFNSIIVKPELMSKSRNITTDFFVLSDKIERLLLDWSAKSLGRLTFEYIDYLDMLPFVKELRERNLIEHKNNSQLSEDLVANLEIMEELAQVIFLLAVEDTMPEKLDQFSQDTWLNAWAISLQTQDWESDGLFQPSSKPRSLNRVMEPLRKCIHSMP